MAERNYSGNFYITDVSKELGEQHARSIARIMGEPDAKQDAKISVILLLEILKTMRKIEAHLAPNVKAGKVDESAKAKAA